MDEVKQSLLNTISSQLFGGEKPNISHKGTSKNIQPPIGTNLSQHILAKTPCYTSV